MVSQAGKAFKTELVYKKSDHIDAQAKLTASQFAWFLAVNESSTFICIVYS